MIDEKTAQQQLPVIQLKDPVMAAFLAWLVPGLGHLYQGRTAKAVLYFVCIMGVFAYGLYLGGNSELGYGRVVYCAFRNDEWRLPYLCQVGVGLPALPACVQSMRMSSGKKVFFNGFMTPPCPADPTGSKTLPEKDPNYDQPTQNTLQLRLNRYFELATVYTMIAGLLNVLVIYDAFSGPVLASLDKKDESPQKASENKKS